MGGEAIFMGSLFRRKSKEPLSSLEDSYITPNFPDPRMVPPEYLNLFHLAAADDLSAFKQQLSDLPASAVRVTVGPQNLLHSAAQNGGREVVKFLLEQGLSVNEGTTGGGVTPLMYAVRGNHEGIVSDLLAKGADANRALSHQDPRYPGLAPLHVAVSAKNESLVKLLLQHGASPQLKDARGVSSHLMAQGNPTMEALLKSVQPPQMNLSTDPQELAQLASDAATVPMGLRIADKIPTTKSSLPADELEGCSAMALLNLASKSRDQSEAEQCLRRLQALSIYSEQGVQANLSNALRHAASHARPAETGLHIAQLMPTLDLFSQDINFREAYSNTLFNISVVADSGEFCHQLSERIMGLEGFAESGDMHFNCGRILSNAAGKSRSAHEAQSYAEAITKLPLFARMPQLHEAAERAMRNASRLN